MTGDIVPLCSRTYNLYFDNGRVETFSFPVHLLTASHEDKMTYITGRHGLDKKKFTDAKDFENVRTEEDKQLAVLVTRWKTRFSTNSLAENTKILLWHIPRIIFMSKKRKIEYIKEKLCVSSDRK